MQDRAGMLVHPFMFPLNRDRDPEDWKIHWFRDGTAMGHVLWALSTTGLARSFDVVNAADSPWPASISGESARLVLFVTATRLPLSDDDQRKAIARSGCVIENAILNRLLNYFTYLERGRAVLTREMSGVLERRNRADIEFPQYHRPCKYFRDLYAETHAERRPVENKKPWRTYGYVVRDQLWIDGPHFLSFFAMDGETNIGFAHLLRTRHASLLEGPGLSIVELSGMIPPKVGSLEFIDEWKSDVILDRAPTRVRPPRTREQACREAPLCGPDFMDAYLGKFGLGASAAVPPAADPGARDDRSARTTHPLPRHRVA
ncbi:MAG: hypothetical protein IT293_13050 [Deltaproteobacteria bacterium]|nr:hypothetical protein [Deltaproteobacteria bacterium]